MQNNSDFSHSAIQHLISQHFLRKQAKGKGGTLTQESFFFPSSSYRDDEDGGEAQPEEGQSPDEPHLEEFVLAVLCNVTDNHRCVFLQKFPLQTS